MQWAYLVNQAAVFATKLQCLQSVLIIADCQK